MKTITALAMGALLATVAACGEADPNEQQSWAPNFLIQQCSPVDPQCQLADPPHLRERPVPDAQQHSAARRA